MNKLIVINEDYDSYIRISHEYHNNFTVKIHDGQDTVELYIQGSKSGTSDLDAIISSLRKLKKKIKKYTSDDDDGDDLI